MVAGGGRLVVALLTLVLVLMASWTKSPSRKPCKSKSFVLPCRCCCDGRDGGRGVVGVGVSPEGTLDKETFKKALQVKKVRGPALSSLLLVVVVVVMVVVVMALLMLVLVLACWTKRLSRRRCKSRRLVLLCWRRCWWSHLSCSLQFEDKINGTIDLIALVLKLAVHSSCMGTSSCWTMTMIFI